MNAFYESAVIVLWLAATVAFADLAWQCKKAGA